MKKIIICAMLLIIANASFSQQINPSPTLTKQDYLKKSKQHKTIAWVLLGTGIFSTGVGTFKFNFAGSEDEVNNSPSAVFLVTGLAAIGTSIPFFIASSKNKKKGMNLSFKNEPVPRIQKSGFVYRTIPSLTLKISL